MVLKQIFEEWSDEHSHTPYPFVDSASLRDTTGEMIIRPTFFTDAKFWPTRCTGRLFLRSVIRGTGTTGVQVTIVLNDLEGEVMRTRPLQPYYDGSALTIPFFDSSGYITGIMIASPGSLTTLADVPNGTYNFIQSATEFVASVVTVVRIENAELVVEDGAGQRLESNVYIVAGDGISFQREGATVFVNAVGNPYHKRDKCLSDATMGNLIRPSAKTIKLTINGNPAGTLKPKDGHIVSTVFSPNQVEGNRSARYFYSGPGRFLGGIPNSKQAAASRKS